MAVEQVVLAALHRSPRVAPLCHAAPLSCCADIRTTTQLTSLMLPVLCMHAVQVRYAEAAGAAAAIVYDDVYEVRAAGQARLALHTSYGSSSLLQLCGQRHGNAAVAAASQVLTAAEHTTCTWIMPFLQHTHQ